MNLNYMNEIRKIEKAIQMIDNQTDGKQIGLRSNLVAVLENLKLTASYMADYINGSINVDTIEMINKSKDNYYKEGDLKEYLNNLRDLMRIERIALICRNQTPDEKAYFLKEYYKYIGEFEQKPKVL